MRVTGIVNLHLETEATLGVPHSSECWKLQPYNNRQELRGRQMGERKEKRREDIKDRQTDQGLVVASHGHTNWPLSPWGGETEVGLASTSKYQTPI